MRRAAGWGIAEAELTDAGAAEGFADPAALDGPAALLEALVRPALGAAAGQQRGTPGT